MATFWPNLGRARPDFGHTRPGFGNTSVEPGPISSICGRDLASIVREVGQCCEELANMWQYLPELDRIRPGLGQMWPALVHIWSKSAAESTFAYARAARASAHPEVPRILARLAPRRQRTQAPEHSLAIASMSPQPIMEGEPGVKWSQGDLLTPTADVSAYRNMRDQGLDNVPMFDSSGAIDQPPLEGPPPTKQKRIAAGLW